MSHPCFQVMLLRVFSTTTYLTATLKSHPKSLSVSQMIKLGKILKPGADKKVLEICSFNLETMSWSCIPQKVEFTLEDDVLGCGGFRKAYKVRSTSAGYNHSTWVVKKYLHDVEKEIQEEHTRKIVQMHTLGKNVASQRARKVKEDNLTVQFADVLEFKDVFFAKIDLKGVTLEEFIEGKFVKYINNTGEVCVSDDNIVGQKAQCLSHFSYEKSNGELMILDLQGSDTFYLMLKLPQVI